MFSDNSMDLELYLDITRMNINRSHDGFMMVSFELNSVEHSFAWG